MVGLVIGALGGIRVEDGEIMEIEIDDEGA